MTDAEIVEQVMQLREDLAKAEERAKIYQELYEKEVNKLTPITRPTDPWYIPPVTSGNTNNPLSSQYKYKKVGD